MSKLQSKEAYDAIIKARLILIVGQPFFGCLALHLNIEEVADPDKVNAIWGSPEAATMAVDGRTMYYAPKFVLSLKEPELVAVVAHETMHCCYRHMSRRGDRHPILFNMAGDYRINWDLKQAGFTLPWQGAAWNKGKMNPGQKGEHFHLLDPQFADMSTEEIYEKIYQDVPKMKISFGAGNDPGSMGTVTDAPGQGSGEGDKKDGQGQGPSTAAAKDAMDREWEATIRIAVNAAQRANAGKLPGYLERLVEHLQAPKVSWRDLLRQYIDQSMSKDHSWQRPNRRFVSSGTYLPGFVPDALHKLVAFVDCSGSISEEMLHEYVSEIAGALDQGTADELVVAYVDTDVRAVDEWLQGDLVKARVVAGGGTDFKTAMEWVREAHPDAQAGIFLTDMMTNSFGEDPGFPMLWAAFNVPASTLASYVPPFGSVIPVDTQ